MHPSSFLTAVTLLSASIVLAQDERPSNCGPDQFGLMMDGGSTGSRIHVYVWCFTPDSSVPVMLHDHFFQTKPGLSSYKDEPHKAGESLKPLFDKAKEFVPEVLRASVPVHFKATAGLRLLPRPEQAEALLESVRDYIGLQGYAFAREWVHILDSVDEAQYAWVTTNYLLGNLGKRPDETWGILDLGGGSVQIAYALPAEASDHMLKVVKVGDKSFRLYATSHLGYGLKEAYNTYAATGSADCTVPADADATAAHRMLNRTFVDCQSKVLEVLFGASSTIKVAAPAVIQHNYLIFSYFYDRLTELGMVDDDHPHLADIDIKASDACSGTDALAIAKEHARMCFDMTYISALLYHGFNFQYTSTHEITIGKQVCSGPAVGGHVCKPGQANGKELGWALGAMIAHMGAPVPAAGRADL